MTDRAESVSERIDRNSLAFWFPPLEAAGLKVPKTRIVETDCDLLALLDGETPPGWAQFVADMENAAKDIGYPCFLRTGHGSGKHQWDRTCNVRHFNDLVPHISALVEWSALVDLMSLPTNVWAVREFIPTAPLCICEAYGNFPVVREFRLFVRDDKVEHTQPYWPPDAVEVGRPDAQDWAERLAAASKATQLEYAGMLWTALAAVDAVGGGFWSVDLLQGADGDWWLTDMAEGDRSFRWEPVA
jgi:hypothetical protein